MGDGNPGCLPGRLTKLGVCDGGYGWALVAMCLGARPSPMIRRSLIPRGFHAGSIGKRASRRLPWFLPRPIGVSGRGMLCSLSILSLASASPQPRKKQGIQNNESYQDENPIIHLFPASPTDGTSWPTRSRLSEPSAQAPGKQAHLLDGVAVPDVVPSLELVHVSLQVLETHAMEGAVIAPLL